MASSRGSAVVTGAAGGLGSEICKALRTMGFEVHATDLDGSVGRTLDVTDAAACSKLAREIDELTLWVNNAGILMTGPTWELSEDRRRLLFDVNTHGTINGTLAALEVMRPSGKGHIINVVSLAGLASPPGEALYAATKHATLGFSLGTLSDLRAARVKDIHISCVCPDGIWTPMLEPLLDDPEAAPSWSGSMLMPADVAKIVAGIVDHPKPVTSIPR